MLKRLFFIVVLCCCAAPISFAQAGKSRGKSKNDKLMTALIDSPDVRGVFGDDAMSVYTQSADLQNIFALGKNAVPLLIAHLDDKRLLRLSTNPPDSRQVTIGAASFDLLTMIIRGDASFYDQKCLKELTETDAEGHASDCAANKYGVFPQDFWNGKKLIVRKSVLDAKRRWQIAYRKQQIHYVKFNG